MKKLAVVAALSCACAVAWAENVLYIKDSDPDATGSWSDWYYTSNYAFADKIDSSVSIAIWAKDRIGAGDRDKFLAGVPGRWELKAPAGSPVKLAFITESGSARASNYVLNDGNWHFVVGTFNYDAENPANSFQRLYVDGQLVAELTTGITAISAPAKMFSLGAASTDMTSTGTFNHAKDFSGYFAELSVWSRALTAAEVSRFYSRKARVGGNESGLVAYWPLTGAPGSVAAAASLAPTAGIPDLAHYFPANSSYVEDDVLTLPYARFVASPEWCAEHSYEQSADATGRSWSDPLTNLVGTASTARKFERILCSPGTHKIASSISPLVEYFYLGSFDPSTGKPCPETAIIDAQELCRHFISSSSVTGESNFTVENLTFVNGRESNGGSMLFKSRIGKINNCIFHDNAATNGQGGAYYAYTANGTVVSNCRFYGNSATSGGGAVYTMQNSDNASDFQRFVNCVFTNNAANGSSGGGVYSYRKVELENCLFADNYAGAYGYGGHARIGIYSDVRDCVFTENGSGTYGSCLNISGASTVVSNCSFRGFSGAGYGTIFIAAGDGRFVDCAFTNNANSSPLFFAQNRKNILVRQCLIGANTSNVGVLSNEGCTFTFENCTIPQAIVTPASPSAVATNTFVNCIIPNATVTSAGTYCNILSNCLVKVAQNGPYDSGVITGNPKFVDEANGDYTLEVKSPCRERGLTLGWMTNGSTDLLGNPRVVDVAGKAFSVDALPDLGCYEIQDRDASGFMMVVW